MTLAEAQIEESAGAAMVLEWSYHVIGDCYVMLTHDLMRQNCRFVRTEQIW